jgi:hypothetical protein
MMIHPIVMRITSRRLGGGAAIAMGQMTPLFLLPRMWTTTTTTTTATRPKRQPQLHNFSTTVATTTTPTAVSKQHQSLHQFPSVAAFSSSATAATKKKTKSKIPLDLPEELAGYDQDRTVFIKICYTEHDVEEGDIVTTKFHWDSICATAEEMFGRPVDDGSLEYYNGDDWIQLKPFELYDVLKFYPCTSTKPLPLRIPALFDEEYGTRNDVVKMKKITPSMRKRQRDILKWDRHDINGS